MGILNKAQILLKETKGAYQEIETDVLSAEETRVIRYVEDSIMRAAKKGNNKNVFKRSYFTKRVIDTLRKEGLIVWDNSEVVTVIVPID